MFVNVHTEKVCFFDTSNENDTFPWKSDETQSGLLVFFSKKTHSKNKIADVFVGNFVKQTNTNPGNCRGFCVRSQKMKIFKDFACFILSCLSLFRLALFFLFFFFECFCSVFLFLFPFVFQSFEETPKTRRHSRVVPIVKLTIFLCSKLILGPRWTGVENGPSEGVGNPDTNLLSVHSVCPFSTVASLSSVIVHT